MLVTPEMDRRNRLHALEVCRVALLVSLLLGLFHPLFWITAFIVPFLFRMIRSRCHRRRLIAQSPFPAGWESILECRVRFYRSLDPSQQDRFRKLVRIFLDEVRVTGVRTEIDDTIRVLVAASAIIPIFGFQDWEYHRLDEVLVYPAAFNDKFQLNETRETAHPNILGLAGFGHLRGVVILSKPSILSAFSDSPEKENVGVHEFAHLIEQGAADGRLPKEIPIDVVRQWIDYVGRELAHPSHHLTWINNYAYTNPHEFFAVLSEYFFGSPEVLKERDPALYDMLRKLFHQDPAALINNLPHHTDHHRKQRRHSPCPCGSGKPLKDCCLNQYTSSQALAAS